MKKIYTIVIITVLMASGRLYGQSNHFPPTGNVGIGTLNPAEALTVTGNIQMSHAKWISYRPGDRFTHDSSLQPHYGIQWINDSQDSDGSMMWVSGYAGIKFFTAGRARIRIDRLGKVGIGTTTPTHTLHVAGSGKWTGNESSYTEIHSNSHGQYLRQFANNGTTVSWVIRGYSYAGEPQAEFNNGGINVNGTVLAKEVRLEATSWPDYVFDKGYDLMSLEEVKAHIDQKGHLPGLKSAKEYEAEGVYIMELNQKLLEKVEELTLHLIRHEEVIKEILQNLDQQKL